MAKHLENRRGKEKGRIESFADAIKQMELLGRASRRTRMIGLARERERERECAVLDRAGAWIKRVGKEEEGWREAERQATTSRRRGLYGRARVSSVCARTRARVS